MSGKVFLPPPVQMKPDVTVTVTLPASDDGVVSYLAAAPADHRHSFAGSGLPFQSEQMAMDRTPNCGELKGGGGSKVVVRLHQPNSYRHQDRVVPPSIHLIWREGGRLRKAVRQLSRPIHSRALSYHPARCVQHATFYEGTHELEVRGQEAVLRSGGYDGGPRNDATSSQAEFWGDRPRL